VSIDQAKSCISSEAARWSREASNVPKYNCASAAEGDETRGDWLVGMVWCGEVVHLPQCHGIDRINPRHIEGTVTVEEIRDEPEHLYTRAEAVDI